MKSNLEQNVKDAFEQYELPYNEAAWKALNEKLDKIHGGTQNKPSSGNRFKWIAGAAIVVIVSSVLIYSLIQNDNNSPQINSTSTAAQTEQNSDNKNESASAITTSKEGKDEHSSDTAQHPENIAILQTVKQPKENKADKNKTTRDSEVSPTAKHTTDKSSAHPNDDNGNSFSPFPINIESSGHRSSIVFPELGAVCEGAVLSIPNRNPFTISIVSPSGKETDILSNHSTHYRAAEAGAYIVRSKKSPELTTAAFTVKEKPKLDFSIDEELQYKDGIPYIPVETYSDGTNFEWSFEGNAVKQYGEKAIAHFYKKGTHEITLKSKNAEGCESTISKTVTIEKDYNLLAPSGFMPLSEDSRKSRFIPFALTLRDTEFKLFIIEPRTGTVIFETNSIEGWDGIDRNTGRLVEENKSFIWKVILATPEPEEQKEYTGIVLRL